MTEATPVAVFNVRLDDDLAARFDAHAAAFGGRSARLRQLIDGVLDPAARDDTARSEPRDALRLMVRLAVVEADHVRRHAAAMRLTPSGWTAALVRRHVLGRPTLQRSEERLLISTHSELRRIGVNVNQIARALNTAVMEGRVLDMQLASVGDLRRELRDHILALGEAFDGNLVYWAVER